MRHRLRDTSLRLRITVALIAIVVGGTAVSTAIGSRIVTEAVLQEARRRVEAGLATARMVYRQRLARVRRGVARCAGAPALARALDTEGRPTLSALLQRLRRDNALDFLGVVDATGRRVTASGPVAPNAPWSLFGGLIAAARHGATIASTEVVGPQTVAEEGLGLAERTPVAPGRETASRRGETVAGGMTLAAAVPLYRASGGSAVYGGVVLDGSTSIVDQVRAAVFGDDLHQGRPVGLVAIYRGQLRVASSLDASGRRALGHRAPEPAAVAVLQRKRPWSGRTLEDDVSFVSAYAPVTSAAGHVVGMLYIGVQEARYLSVRTRMMLSFLVVAALGVVVVLGLVYFIARGLTRPLEEMVLATQRIADGELEHEVRVAAEDEIGTLARSFNVMVASLARARDELRQWAQTLEERVEERSAELMRVQRRMGDAERLASLGRMAAGVAHEINNPLGGILTFASLGRDDLAVEHPQRRNFEIIVQQTLRCRDIVRGLLEFSRESASAPAPTNIDEVTRKALQLLRQQACFQDIEVIEAFEADLPPVLIDPGQLQQVVVNLLINAADAMEHGGRVTLRAAAHPEQQEVTLEVADTGKGIPHECLPLLFEPFFTTKEAGRGTGLGLSIVHGIITRAGGRIDVQSSPAGSCFTLRFPAALGNAKREEPRQ